MAEWDKLAAWVIDNRLISHNVRWLIQVRFLARIADQANRGLETNAELLDSTFVPYVQGK